jgi:hypothetical protein
MSPASLRGGAAWRPCRTIAAYDENLAVRIRELIGSERDRTEKKMFGGLAFLLGEHGGASTAWAPAR